VVGDCFVSGGLAHAVVLVRNDGTGSAQTYTVTVQLGPSGGVNLEQQVQVIAAPGQTGSATVNAPATGAPDGKISCSIVSIKDSSGATPAQAGTLPPPPDTQPQPTITTAPRTGAPATSGPAPRTSAPATSVPRTSAPRTSPVPTTSPSPSVS
jgi:hypothetical protein